jgi:hypothetical protein
VAADHPIIQDIKDRRSGDNGPAADHPIIQVNQFAGDEHGLMVKMIKVTIAVGDDDDLSAPVPQDIKDRRDGDNGPAADHPIIQVMDRW